MPTARIAANSMMRAMPASRTGEIGLDDRLDATRRAAALSAGIAGDIGAGVAGRRRASGFGRAGGRSVRRVMLIHVTSVHSTRLSPAAMLRGLRLTNACLDALSNIGLTAVYP